MSIQVVYYKDKRGHAPVLDWLRNQQARVIDKCAAKIIRLKELGHKLVRPEAEYLRDGIYELRISHSGQQYRILYFFHERKAVVLAHSLVKKSNEVPNRDIDLAIKRKVEFDSDTARHTFQTDEIKEP